MGKQTVEEFDKIKQHPVRGVQIIELLLHNKPELRFVRSHHERFDGKGYPDGLQGKQIPLEARIMTVADCFDAMTSDRPYRSAMSKEYALAEIKNNKRTQFFPEIADVFIDSVVAMPDDLYFLISNGKSESTVLVS